MEACSYHCFLKLVIVCLGTVCYIFVLIISVFNEKEVSAAYCSYLKPLIVYHSYCLFDFMYILVIFIFIEEKEFHLHTVTNSDS